MSFLFFLFGIYEIVDSMDIYKSLNINNETVMENPEMLELAPDHLKMCKHTVKKSPYLLKYIPDRYKTQKMCNKAILENGGALMSFPDCYKIQEMFNN